MTARSPEDIKDELLHELFDSRCDPPCGYCGDSDHLDKWLDDHPCPFCGGHYNDHNYLTAEEIDDAREQGCTVDICDNHVEDQDQNRGSTLFCMVTRPPEDPCDSAFMEGIST